MTQKKVLQMVQEAAAKQDWALLTKALVAMQEKPKKPKRPKKKVSVQAKKPSRTQVEKDVDTTDSIDPRPGEKNYTRKLPFEIGKNQFVDDLTLERNTIKESKRLSKIKEPEVRRPKVKMVKVVCHECGSKYEVIPALAPKKIGEDENSYQCDRCLSKKISV